MPGQRGDGAVQFASMGRIKGYYEWDNDDLTPGQKKEGGLHQNLFDREGKLQGSARFVPEREGEPAPAVTETVYIHVEERRKSAEQEELERVIAELILHFLYRGVAKATPLVEQWWRERGRPALHGRRARRLKRHPLRRSGEDAAAVLRDEVDVVKAEEAPTYMSSAEAKARYLAALAACAYSDEQMRLVAGATIVDGESRLKLGQSLPALPADQVKVLLEAMATNPSLLAEENLAELASVLSRHALAPAPKSHQAMTGRAKWNQPAADRDVNGAPERP